MYMYMRMYVFTYMCMYVYMYMYMHHASPVGPRHTPTAIAPTRFPVGAMSVGVGCQIAGCWEPPTDGADNEDTKEQTRTIGRPMFEVTNAIGLTPSRDY